MTFEQESPGLFIVRYAAPGDLLPAEQAPLIRAVEQAEVATTALVFEVGPEIRSVDMAVPNYWLEVTSRRELKLAAFAIVSASAAVRVAASGFGLANKIRGVPLLVKAFTDSAEALDWVREVLASASGA